MTGPQWDVNFFRRIAHELSFTTKDENSVLVV
jgi:hypothetical protein